MTMPSPDCVAERWVVSPLTSIGWREGRLEITTAGSEVKLATEQVDLMRVLHAFAEPRTVEEVIDELTNWRSREVAACVSELVDAGALELVSARQPRDGREWDAPSLAFHRSSRAATFRPLSGVVAPAVASRRGDEAIALSRTACEQQRSVVDLLEARRSSRTWPAATIPFDVFSRLLWLSARNRSIGDAGSPDERVSRPYPSGGAAYSLELYPVIAPDAVESITPGVYRYVPEDHGLESLSRAPADRDPFLVAAARSAGCASPPVVIVIASRYARQAATYGTLAYSLVLKEVGCLFQTIYLVAADLGLGACALGGGAPEELLARLSNVGAYVEPVVGEIMLGPADQGPRTRG